MYLYEPCIHYTCYPGDEDESDIEHRIWEKIPRIDHKLRDHPIDNFSLIFNLNSGSTAVFLIPGRFSTIFNTLRVTKTIIHAH